MSLLTFLAQLGIGVANNMIRNHAQRRQSEPDFAGFIHQLAQYAGLRVVNIGNNSATFGVEMNGREHAIVFVYRGDVVSINVLSGIIFPRGRVPTEVCQVLADESRNLGYCEFDVLDGDDGSRFYIKARVRPDQLTPAVFEEIVADTAPKIHAVDRLLLNHGYAR
jgi:hypothetical protein